VSDEADRTSAGRLFHSQGPAVANDRSPLLLWSPRIVQSTVQKVLHIASCVCACVSKWPAVVKTLMDKIQRYTGLTFNSLLANLYRDKQNHISWHADDEVQSSITAGNITSEKTNRPIPGFSLCRHSVISPLLASVLISWISIA